MNSSSSSSDSLPSSSSESSNGEEGFAELKVAKPSEEEYNSYRRCRAYYLAKKAKSKYNAAIKSINKQFDSDD